MNQQSPHVKQMRPLIWLLGAAVAQLIAYWYPSHVAQRYPSPDGDGRYFVLPAVVFGAGLIAVVTCFCLLRRIWDYKGLINGGIILVAGWAALVALTPPCLLMWRILTGQ